MSHFRRQFHRSDSECFTEFRKSSSNLVFSFYGYLLAMFIGLKRNLNASKPLDLLININININIIASTQSRGGESLSCLRILYNMLYDYAIRTPLCEHKQQTLRG